MNIYNKNTNIKKLVKLSRQKGFTLVTVLILSSLASILVLTSLKDNITQERLSGNYQKKINARLASERGVSESINAARNAIDLNEQISIEELLVAMSVTGGEDDITFLKGATFDLTATNPTGSEILLSSTGNRFEGQKTISARFLFIPGSRTRSPFNHAVLGCEGVTMSGSSQVDSFNAKTAAPNQSNPGTEGDVAILRESGDVILNGGSPIYGDVVSPGKIILQSSIIDRPSVYGNLHANSDITLENSGLLMRVLGNVLTRGNYIQKGGVVGGHVRVVGNATMNYSTYINNAMNDGDDIWYGGTGSFSDNSGGINHRIQTTLGDPDTTGYLIDAPYNGTYLNRPYKQDSVLVAEVQSDRNRSEPNNDDTDANTNCDPLKIDTIVDEVKGAELIDFTSGTANQIYTLTPYSMKEDEADPLIYSHLGKVLGANQPVLSFNNFILKGNVTVNVTGGDVTLYVKNKVELHGSSKISVAAGSSLTLIVQEGPLKFKGEYMMPAPNSNGEFFPMQYSLSGLPPISIYLASATATIDLTGDFKLYAAIYAPKAELNISGSGTLYGSIRAKNINLTGAGNIHFDSTLSESGGGGGGRRIKTKLEFIGMTY